MRSRNCTGVEFSQHHVGVSHCVNREGKQMNDQAKIEVQCKGCGVTSITVAVPVMGAWGEDTKQGIICKVCGTVTVNPDAEWQFDEGEER